MKIQNLFIIFTTLCYLFVNVLATDYCAKFSRDHTLCKYKEGVAGKQCSLYGKPIIVNQPMTNEQQAKIVDLHNSYRSGVALGKTKFPTASNMRKMSWDDDLAKVAQRWADQCQYGHDCKYPVVCRSTDTFQNAGQNVYGAWLWGRKLQLNITEGISNWYDEIKDTTINDIKRFPSWSPKVIGHFTQLIWADTYKIGCGFSQFPAEPLRGMTGEALVLACNYGPQGNFINSAVYKSGVTASQCASRSVNGLCV